MFRSFRAQLVVSFFLVIVVTPLLFISLFFGPLGRYLRAGGGAPPFPSHARVIANLVQEELARGAEPADAERLLRAAVQGTLYRLVLLDPGGNTLADSARSGDAGRSGPPSSEVEGELSGAPAVRGEGHVHRIAVPIAVRGEPFGSLLVIRPSSSPNRHYLSLASLLPRAVIGLIIAGVLGLFLSRRLLRPVSELTRAAEALASGDLAQRVDVPPHGELGRLADRFNHMASRIEDLVTRLSGEHERLRAAHTRVAESERRQRELIANVSHELRTPLACIRASIEALVDGVADDEEKRQRCLRTIEQETVALSRLVEDLLTLSRIDSGQLPLQQMPVRVQGLFERCATRFLPRAAEQGVALESVCPEGLSFTGDDERVTQVLSNLLDNALRHTPAGGTIRLEAGNDAEGVWLRVTDTGIGIPPEHLPHLFDRLYRVEKSRSKGSGGSGLGLAIAREIVDAHGGTIAAESAPGKGTAITIRLHSHPVRSERAPVLS